MTRSIASATRLDHRSAAACYVPQGAGGGQASNYLSLSAAGSSGQLPETPSSTGGCATGGRLRNLACRLGTHTLFEGYRTSGKATSRCWRLHRHGPAALALVELDRHIPSIRQWLKYAAGVERDNRHRAVAVAIRTLWQRPHLHSPIRYAKGIWVQTRSRGPQ
jgi:hypothetical protein